MNMDYSQNNLEWLPWRGLLHVLLMVGARFVGGFNGDRSTRWGYERQSVDSSIWKGLGLGQGINNVRHYGKLEGSEEGTKYLFEMAENGGEKRRKALYLLALYSAHFDICQSPFLRRSSRRRQNKERKGRWFIPSSPFRPLPISCGCHRSACQSGAKRLSRVINIFGKMKFK